MSKRILVKDKGFQYVIIASVCLIIFVTGFFYVNNNISNKCSVQAITPKYKEVVIKDKLDAKGCDFFLNLIMSNNSFMQITYSDVSHEKNEQSLIKSGFVYLLNLEKVQNYIANNLFIFNDIVKKYKIDNNEAIKSIENSNDSLVATVCKIDSTPLLEEIKDAQEINPDVAKDILLDDIIIIDDTTDGLSSVSGKLTADEIKKIKNELNFNGDLCINKEKPYILIYHTHATEVYLPIKDDNFHSKKKEYSVMEVGEIINNTLNKKGHNTKQVQIYHDLPSYNKSYSRSLATIKKEIKKEKNIKVLIDIHRDGVPSNAAYISKSIDESKVCVNNKQAATFKFVIGADCPNKEELIKFAKYIMAISERMYPGLCKGLVIKPYGKYNLFLSDFSMLLEVGSNLNTIEEAKNTSVLLANVLDMALKNIIEP
ncbi:stage II sporulation protein P [Abyssisolibacter fermentans]|uniref:stage II sporulation protein P n=1 Tax=Abyssisolibacter fermentans TaxID=1766203 RepID=UPI00082AB78A|nr:stage II sporulation protein P [Abyssisolibacter fermentans]